MRVIYRFFVFLALIATIKIVLTRIIQQNSVPIQAAKWLVTIILNLCQQSLNTAEKTYSNKFFLNMIK